MASAKTKTKKMAGLVKPKKMTTLPGRKSDTKKPESDMQQLLLDKKQAEKRLTHLEREKQKMELDLINRELATSATYIAQKNKILGLVRKNFNRVFLKKKSVSKNEAYQILQSIDETIKFDNDWYRIKAQFEKIYPGYFDRLRKKHPQLTPTDHKLCALLRMNLNTREISQILKITAPSAEISRIRLRKKLDLDKSTNLTQFVCMI
jgi:DNA-binding CsgD family transcriptional regulator